jgi:hypothetical protein
MKTIGSLIILLLAFSTAMAQKGYYADYNWDKTPKKYSVTEEELKQDEVIVFEKRSVELREKDEGFIQMMLVHTITLLNTDAAIEENNKVYVANGPEANVIRQQARVIKPDGTVIELDQDDIQESKDENGTVEYRYFAMDGVEKGCYIEYLHYMERSPNFTGAVMSFQGGVVKKDIEVDIICPKMLEYLIHPINGMPEFKRDSTAYLVRRMYVHQKDVPALEDEPWSAYEAQLQKCYYKVNRNTEAGTSNFYNYAAITKIIHQNMYEKPSKKAKKAMQKLIKDSDPGEGATLEARVRALENKVKSEINVINLNIEGIFDLEFILTKKLTDEEGMTKLMVQLLREMGIKHELVLTSNKNENPFLAEFEGYNFLVEDMVYINDLDMYMSPGFISRLGFPPYYYTNTKGLFIKEISVNDMTTAVGKIKDIKGTKGDQSVDEINTKVTFDEGMADCSVEVERIATGYKAEYPQAILDFLEEDRKTEAREEFLKYVDKDAKLENPTYENDNTSSTGVRPLIGRATIKGTTFIEKAGDKTLLKAGLLIGPQAELYNEDERTLPVETAYTRQYKRTIVINIPKDQTVKNPEALVFNVTPDKTNNSAGFVSSYEIKGDQLIVTIFEYYNVTTYTAADYYIYEDVMNAAADFNKVVLVFDKK